MSKKDDMTKTERKARLRAVRVKNVKLIATTFASTAGDMLDKDIKNLSRDLSKLSLKYFGSC